MITIRVNIEHDDDTQGEPRNVTTEAMFDFADKDVLCQSAVNLALAAYDVFAVKGNTMSKPLPEPLASMMNAPSRPIRDSPQA